MTSKDEILSILSNVIHPGKGEKNIVELGMIHSIDLDEASVRLTLAFSKRRDPLAEYLIGSAKASLTKALPEGTQVEVDTIVVDEVESKTQGNNIPTPDLTQINGVSHVIAIASGKGGVGKSTVAVNLACALARAGYKTGLADADVYGPSVPIMTGTEGMTPYAEEYEGAELILPIEKYGVKWMSIGYFAEKGQALIWRGPMASNALRQMLLQVKWGELDFLLVDLPPGTGDIHIGLIQDIPLSGAVIVTTPQEVALADVEKGIDLFTNEKVNSRILGLVENMAWFTPAEHPEEKYYIFGKDGGAKLAKHFNVELLGQIPLVQSIRESGDNGEPLSLGAGPEALAFLELAGKLAEKLS